MACKYTQDAKLVTQKEFEKNREVVLSSLQRSSHTSSVGVAQETKFGPVIPNELYK